MAVMKSVPAHLKLVKKRGTYFACKSSSSGNPDVVKLMRGFNISLAASPLGDHCPRSAHHRFRQLISAKLHGCSSSVGSESWFFLAPVSLLVHESMCLCHHV